jgi:chemotaxis protein MotB
MQTARFSVVFFLCIFLITLGGCGSELQDLRIKNDTQRTRIASLESELRAAELKINQLNRSLSSVGEQGNIELESIKAELAAMKEQLADKDAKIAQLVEKLLHGGGQLPVELTSKLEELANQYDMITYDATRGVLKFKSDLLFDKASDVVSTSAVGAVKSLCSILNTSEAAKFDIIVAGHTDDIPILKPQTREKHPTNWHLSAHRGISVLKVMMDNNIKAERLSVRGFGEFKPVEPNKPDKKGNPKNRRVEIYIVAQGM